jgi:hypothetical protein
VLALVDQLLAGEIEPDVFEWEVEVALRREMGVRVDRPWASPNPVIQGVTGSARLAQEKRDAMLRLTSNGMGVDGLLAWYAKTKDIDR